MNISILDQLPTNFKLWGINIVPNKRESDTSICQLEIFETKKYLPSMLASLIMQEWYVAKPLTGLDISKPMYILPKTL